MSEDEGDAEEIRREAHTCRKCGVDRCPRRSSITRRKSRSRDYNKVSCRRRNSERPRLNCSVGWAKYHDKNLKV